MSARRHWMILKVLFGPGVAATLLGLLLALLGMVAALKYGLRALLGMLLLCFLFFCVEPVGFFRSAWVAGLALVCLVLALWSAGTLLGQVVAWVRSRA